MKIELQEITVREVVSGYSNNQEDGVLGYGGKLNIRPKYQREFIYKDDQRNAVLDTIRRGFPLNVMYWVKTDQGDFEVLDGQQRTVSFCEYVAGLCSEPLKYAGSFSICDTDGNPQYFHNLPQDQQEQILDYKLMIYVCEGSDSEKLDWFKIINIAGEKLSDQELRNAVYTGEWLVDAKRYFSKTGCAAYDIAHDYLRGSAIRQDYLETAIKWISSGAVEVYMSKHQQDQNANALWLYFQGVVSWVKALFPVYRREMKGVEWGYLYNQHKDDSFNTDTLEDKTRKLMLDDDVTRKSGIYEYLLSGDEKHLSIRAFSPAMRRSAFELQKGICPRCNNVFDFDETEADHIVPWHAGGKTTAENCQMLCKNCNRRKSGK